MKKFKLMRLFLTAAVTCFTALCCFLNAEAKNLDLKIIFTNDIHGKIVGDENVKNGKFIGYSKIASYMAQAKNESKNTLVIDAGDAFHGDTIANLSQGQAVLSVMNQIGYNYFVPGNHDFNFGKDRLIELAKKGNFKTICSNLLNNGTPMFAENDIVELNGVKIGIFGLTSPELITKSDAKNIEGLQILDPIESAKKQVEILESKGADLIILISHLGILTPEKSWRSYAVRDIVGDIDLIIDSHSHNVLHEYNQSATSAAVTSAGIGGQNLGVVDIKIQNDNKEIKLWNLNFADFKYISKSERVDDIIKAETEKIKPILEEKIGYTNVYLNGDREIIRTKETNLAKITCEAVLKETGADVVFLNAGGFRGSIEAGDITMEDVLRVFSLNHFVITKQVSGGNIIKALELAVKQYPDMSAIFPQVAGITFEIATSKDGNKVKNVFVNGEKIDVSKEYVFATNNFLASGGDGFEMLKSSKKLKQFDSLDKIFAKYVSQISPVGENAALKKVA